MTEWQLYAQKLEGDTWRGEKLDQDKLNKMSGLLPRLFSWIVIADGAADQQVGQLYELLNAIKNDSGEGKS